MVPHIAVVVHVHGSYSIYMYIGALHVSQEISMHACMHCRGSVPCGLSISPPPHCGIVQWYI